MHPNKTSYKPFELRCLALRVFISCAIGTIGEVADNRTFLEVPELGRGFAATSQLSITNFQISRQFGHSAEFYLEILSITRPCEPLRT
jgi:hypothetical protein